MSEAGEAKVGLKSVLTKFCGPHCGKKDGKEGHCPSCHTNVTHSNAVRTEKGWEAR